MDTDYLQQRLDARADKKLRCDINSAVPDLPRSLNKSWLKTSLVRRGKSEDLTVNSALEIVRKALFNEYQKEYRQRETEEFLGEILNVEDQLEELRKLSGAF